MSVDIGASRERIWPWLIEGEKAKRWVSWLVEVRPVGPAGDSKTNPVGRTEIWVMKDENNGGKFMEVTGTCTEYAEPDRLSAALSSPGSFEGVQSYRLVDLGGGRTRLEVNGSYRFSEWFARLLEPLIMPQARKKLEGDLARLKSEVESTGPSAAAR